ncbi:BACON domain-containing protein [Bacteroides sp. 519]|uniref:BACON domain-containing protein n=1 Tax=Bacteroides sp. 519 TaxID=2302937 RepID=UPI0013D63EAC|nr:BACON domain-containing protein [Bacteroides sp. 519]NDV59526.1 hypothetical protein [Bacteroides sp. 519]
MKKLQTNILTVFSVWLLVLVLVTSCVDDLYQPDYSSDGKELTFILNLPKASVVETRAGFAERESIAGPVYILVFNKSTNILEDVIKLIQGTNETTDGYFIPTDLDGCYKITNKFALDKTLVALANLQEDYFESTLITTDIKTTLESYIGSGTKTDIAKALKTIQFPADPLKGANKWFINPFSDDKYHIPMWGELTDYSYGKTNQFNMIRMLVKIDIEFTENALKEFNIPTPLGGLRFYNQTTCGYIIPDNYDADNMAVTKPTGSNTDLSQATTNPEREYLAYTGSANWTGSQCLDRIYTFEVNHSGIFPPKDAEETWYTDPEHQKWKQNPCIIIRGTYKGEQGYYRIDFIDNEGNWLDLLRNHRYHVVIKDVRGKGYSSWMEAYNHAPQNMDVTTYVANASEKEEVAVDGPYFMSVEDVDILRSGEKEELEYTYKTNYDTDPIFTSYEDEECTMSGASWLSGSKSDNNGFFIIKTTSDNNSGETRTGYLKVSIGRMSIVIKVTQVPRTATYVGAFWRHNENAERLIRSPLPKEYDCDWEASVLVGQEWIRMDTKRGPDHPNGSTEKDTDSAKIANPENRGGNYYVTATTTSVRGSSTATMKDEDKYVYFRIGLKDRIPESDHRYGVILFTYTIKGSNGRNFTRQQYIWVRQGEDADYLVGSKASSTQDRPYVPFSPYNLTSAEYSAYPTSAVMRQRLAVNGGVFTEYPSQAGVFSISLASIGVQEDGDPIPDDDVIIGTTTGKKQGTFQRYVFHPTNNDKNAAWSNYGITNYYYWDQHQSTTLSGYKLSLNPEICPKDYRRPNDGATDKSVDRGIGFGTDHTASEMRHSLFHSLTIDQLSLIDNSVYGYYADGFFDRRKIETPPGADPWENSAVAKNTAHIAYAGRLFYNPSNHKSLFFPAAGYLNVKNPQLLNEAGRKMLYFTASIYKEDGNYSSTWALHGNTGSIDGTASMAPKTDYSRERYAGSIRCVKN